MSHQTGRYGVGEKTSRQGHLHNNGNVKDQIVRRLKKADRSCVVCNRRKVRCDKKMPCSTCTRTGVLCCYPSEDKPLQRQPKATIADIASRLVQLERTLVAISSLPTEKTSTEDAPTSHNDATVSTGEETPESSYLGEVLIQDTDSGYYINDILFSQVLKEEQDIRSMLASDDSSEQSILSPSFTFMGISSSSSTVPESCHSLHPTASQAMELWRAFIQNVDPLTKVLHIPTAQITIFTALNAPQEASPTTNCLLFAIYFAAITSLTPNDVRSILVQEKTKALDRFKLGFESSLVQSNFFEYPTVMAIQALTLYLKTARAHKMTRSLWIMCGLTIRAAQSIGLHRDGTNFDLSPFDTEMRRRVWWQLSCHESRASEDHGITVSNPDLSTDARFPSNANDTDLDPDMTEFPTSQSKWTEMTLPLLMMKSCHNLRHAYVHMLGLAPSNPSVQDARQKESSQHIQNAEDLLKYCNPVVPIQRATIIMSRILLRKLQFMKRQRWQTITEPAGQAKHATEENLANACEILELQSSFQKDEQLRDYCWSGESQPQYHVILHILWQLCVKPTGENVERAWSAIDSAFHLENDRQLRQGSSSAPKWVALAMLRDKAFRIRDSVSRDQSASLAPGAAAPEQAATEVGVEVQSTNFGRSSLEDMDWDDKFLDWNTFMDDMNVEDYNFDGA